MESKLTYKVIGGLLDFYFFAGSSPLDAVQQFIDSVGHSCNVLLSFWYVCRCPALQFVAVALYCSLYLYFFADLSPLNAVQQFTDLVGHTAATPYWASV
ncbi:alpha-glucosidase-like isoform X2 [Cryptomeria japonica]|uniref:alpha-glucosidase-like isoform X2 n=1 Tax=Cryptomeria japonica TaxID=3369 RepID=UPI0027DA49B7|nr:alpha-glucosidase-like isoform X2 [Cryptomeria japonica]